MLNNSQNTGAKPKRKRYAFTAFRPGELAQPLADRAASESRTSGRRVTPSTIIKRALRAYLGEGDVVHFDASGLIEAVNKLRLDLARVGGNLNQLAHTFNLYSQIDEAERDRTFKELQAEFRTIITAIKEIERELYRRR